jgi:hypothetical protein
VFGAIGRGLGLTVEIRGDSKSLSKELDASAGDVKGFGVNVGSSALKLAAFAGAAGIAANVIADVTTAAAEDAAEQGRLEAAIRAAGAATGDYNAVVDEAIAKGQDKAFTDTQTRDALQSLVTSTGDLTSATTLLSTAQDIARFANVDLATAADAVAKANAGQDGALRKLMPGLAKGATATDTLAAATAAAAGQADTFANSTQGMQERGSDAFSELGETIGSVFLPMLDAILPSLIPVIKSFGTLITAILPVILPLLRLLGQALGIVANALSTVVGWLGSLIRWLSSAAGAVGRFLDAINPLKGISLPSLPFLSSAAAPAASSLGRSVGGRSSGGGGGVTINVYGDPDTIRATVLEALRTYDRRNGLGGALAR